MLVLEDAGGEALERLLGVPQACLIRPH